MGEDDKEGGDETLTTLSFKWSWLNLEQTQANVENMSDQRNLSSIVQPQGYGDQCHLENDHCPI
jgi:hypothetical protein